MRFMMVMIPNIPDEADWTPDPEAVVRMGRYNEELTKAGVLLALDGLHPASKGARVAFSGGAPSITDGPFTEAKEVIGGYWMIQVASREEAIEWVKRCPAGPDDVIEIRRVHEPEDFGPTVAREERELLERIGRNK